MEEEKNQFKSWRGKDMIGLWGVKIGSLTLWYGVTNYVPGGYYSFVKALDADGKEVQISDDQIQRGFEEISQRTKVCEYRHVFP
jgi:hypothetical protein